MSPSSSQQPTAARFSFSFAPTHRHDCVHMIRRARLSICLVPFAFNRKLWLHYYRVYVTFYLFKCSSSHIFRVFRTVFDASSFSWGKWLASLLFVKIQQWEKKPKDSNENAGWMNKMSTMRCPIKWIEPSQACQLKSTWKLLYCL